MQGDWDFLHHILEQYSHVFIHINIYNKDKFIINIFIHKYIHFFFLLKLVSINKTILHNKLFKIKLGSIIAILQVWRKLWFGFNTVYKK